MPRHPESTLAAIKNALDIVALVGEYLPLHRSGSKFKALCPFHDDHNPSLELNADRQSYKCWSCGAGGDIFDFVKEYERVEFPEALRMLADRAGIALDDRPEAGAPASGPTRADLLAAAAWAEGVFVEALQRSDEALAYLAARGIEPEVAATFRLGHAPESRDFLATKARKGGPSTDALERVGLIARGAEPPHALRERFRGRLIFPIHDQSGRTLGFGGRILPSAQKKLAEMGRDVAKYLNSPETALFQKRRLLYAADLARPAARAEGWVAVVEGYTDVIAAHRAGLSNVVATLGTALGDDHVTALRRLADRVVLVFDGDAAGQAAADRSLEIFLGHEVDLRVLALPGGLDPADFLNAEGAAPFRAMVDAASDPLAFAIRRAADRFDLQSVEGSRQAAEWVLAIFARVPRENRAGLDLKVAKALDALSGRLGVPVADLKRRLAQLRREAAARSEKSERLAAQAPANPATAGPVDFRGPTLTLTPTVMPIRPDSLDPIDRELVGVALNEPESVDWLAARVPAGSLREPILRTILQACYDLRREGLPPTFDRVSLRLDDPSARSLAAGLLLPMDSGRLPEDMRPAPWATRLAGVLAALADRDRRDRRNALWAAIQETDPATDPDQHRALLLEYYRFPQQQRPDSKAKSAS